MRHCKRACVWRVHNRKAFTLAEVLMALAVTAIGLVPLLHLLVVSIWLLDTAACLSEATLIGNAKLAEAASTACPAIGTDSGFVEQEGRDVVFRWQRSVTDVPARAVTGLDLSGLRRIGITVMWEEGQRDRQVSLSRYVSVDATGTDTMLEGKNLAQQW